MKKFITIILSALYLIIASSCEKDFTTYNYYGENEPEQEKLVPYGLFEKLTGCWDASKVDVTRKYRVNFNGMTADKTDHETYELGADTDRFQFSINGNQIVFREVDKLNNEYDIMTAEVTINYDEKNGKLSLTVLTYEDDDKEFYELAEISFKKK